MIAVIKSGRLLRKSFFYNENKVEQGVASLLDAVNYPLNADQLSQVNRLNLLERMAALRPDIERPAMHISLNFAPGESLTDEQLRQVSKDYMKAIGFGDQPYLLYRHQDAGHPHVHIVSLRVRPDGSNIDTFNIGKKLSRPAEQALEEKYNLVRSADHKKEVFQLHPVNAAIVQYGKVATKRAIGNVLDSVLDKYKYASLEQLNAVLKCYNVQAQRGQEDSRLYQYKGLLYRVIDGEGSGIGTPVKASAFAYKATLKDIEKRFLRHDVARQQYKSAMRLTIEKALRQQQASSFPALTRLLKTYGIDLTLHQSKDGQVYGITYIDHRNKAVFNGSDLGKAYSAKMVIERLAGNLKTHQPEIFVRITHADKMTLDPTERYSDTSYSAAGNIPRAEQTEKSLLEYLLQPEYSAQSLPYELRKNRRKKKRKISM